MCHYGRNYDHENEVAAEDVSDADFTIALGFSEKCHASDALNFSQSIAGKVTEAYIRILTPKGTINQSIFQNRVATDVGASIYWHNFSVNRDKKRYGWPECGNGTYCVYMVTKTDEGTDVSTFNFTMYPNADVNMDNVTNFIDITSITQSEWWGEMGVNRFCYQDLNGDGYVNVFDLTYITGPRNWGWRNTA